MTAAVTLSPANAALVAAGVQTIVTLPTKPKALTAGDRLVIHAGTKLPKGGQHIGEFIVDDDGEGPYLVRRVGRYSGEPLLMFTHPGHIVGSAVVRDCVPCHDTDGPDIPRDLLYMTWDGRNLFRQRYVNDGMRSSDVTSDDLTDQLPFSDFTPGRWALLLDDVQDTTDRCPACWGQGVVLAGCDWCNVEGTCEPIPWRGRPDVWEVTW